MMNPGKPNPVYSKMCTLALMLMCLCLLLNAPLARAQPNAGFDHAATSFQLWGAHEQVRCESCHIKGIFRGTPKECMGCHVVNNQRGATAMPFRHVQITSGCDSCHNVSSFGAVVFSHTAVGSGGCWTCHDGTRATGKPANHVATTSSCDVCHSTLSFAPARNFPHETLAGDTSTCGTCHDGQKARGMPANHIPRSNAAQCANCHAQSLTSFTSFAGGKMDHTGMNSGCADCHGPSIKGGTFAGISSIVVMPPTSPAGPGSHIPSSVVCESCHLASMPAGLIDANAARTAPGSGFATPAPSNAQIHQGVTGGCNACHDTNFTWMGMSAYPIAPTTIVDKAQYTGFHTRPVTAATAYSVADPAHPNTGDCSQCHSGTAFFVAAESKPANHIPVSSTAQCTACHTSTDYAVMPTLANIHAYAPSTTSNCAQCHAASVVAGFAIPAANFTVVGPPANHMPITTACETCHVGPGSSVTTLPVGNGAKFSNSLFSHSGITANCADCHGPGISGASFAGVSRIVVMPPTTPAGVASSHIPSSTACESCHLGSTPNGLVVASSSKTAPGTAFATPVPTTVQIHSGITAGCSACHETNYTWMGMSAYPIAPTTLSSGAQYTGFHTRPKAAAGTYSVADAAHPGTGDCSQCHSGTNYFTGQDVPANHIPFAPTAQCNSCHTSTDYAVMPTLANIHANAPSTTSNCAQCHAASVVAGFAIPAANFTVVGSPANHMPITTACETCHVGAGSSVTSLPVGNGAKFSNSLFSHSGITNNCVACHGPSITGASFAGVSKIVVMPPTSPVGATSHIPSSTTCESCHLGSTPSGLVAASGSKTAPGTAFATPAPTTTQIHAGITGGCNACHETNYVWMGMSAYPISPTTLSSSAQYIGFHTRPKTTASTYAVADAAHPTTGDCSQCHSGVNYFSGQAMPTNHIPTSTTALCSACHTATDYAVMPTLANIHANAPSTTSNCAQCHAASVVAGFAIPAANFTVVGSPANHMPITTACETCHVGAGSSVTSLPVGNGAKFSNSLFSHNGITNNCVACHGPSITGASFAGVSQIVVMPPTTPAGVATSHIPSSTTCESCHLGSTPNGLVAASSSKTAPGTAFATPAPTTTQIHAGITGGCNACHETNYVWMGMSAYPIAPTTLTSGAQYTGFHSRPKTTASTYSVADAAHPTTGDCSQCHSGVNYFSGQTMPSNHIPTSSTATCTACHTSTDYAAMPTLANIHANAPSTTSNCAQCHAASVVAGFAIPAANFTVVGSPANHMPITTACETCHVGAGSSVTSLPVGNGAKFSNSLFSHSGITNNCVACHGPSITGASFAGVSKIVVMPPTSPVGASSHIPSSTVCENCHLGSTPSGSVAASGSKTAPGTAFATPIPTTTQIHAGITGGCNACHDTNYVWMGMSVYPISPTTLSATAQYIGFHSRPVATASTYSVADAAHPATGDCSQCHSGVNYFAGGVKPAGHMPTTGACATCHIVAGDYSVAGLASNTVLHTGITSGCITCHTAGAGAGPFAGCTTQAACASLPPVTYQPKVMPLVAGGSPTAPSSSTHVPAVGVACEACHSASVFTSFVGMNMKGNTNAHVAVQTADPTCITCHEGGYKWYGVTNLVTASVGHHSRKAGQDCVSCHTKVYTKFSGAAARVRPIMRGALNTINQRVMPDASFGLSVLSGEEQPFSHAGVLPGQCQTCHNGQAAVGMPARHLQTRLSCDNCHRSTAWKPAQFSHQGVVPSQCQTCHNSVVAGGKSGGHFVTTRSCDTCHRTVAWLPVSYAHMSPLYQPQPDKSTCVSCHVINGEIIPRQMRGNNRPKPIPVRPAP